MKGWLTIWSWDFVWGFCCISVIQCKWKAGSPFGAGILFGGYCCISVIQCKWKAGSPFGVGILFGDFAAFQLYSVNERLAHHLELGFCLGILLHFSHTKLRKKCKRKAGSSYGVWDYNQDQVHLSFFSSHASLVETKAEIASRHKLICQNCTQIFKLIHDLFLNHLCGIKSPFLALCACVVASS